MSPLPDNALYHLVGDAAEFRDRLPTEPVLLERPVEPFSSLLSFARVDYLLSTVPLRPPFLEVSRENQKVPHQYFTFSPVGNDPLLSGFVDPVALSELLGDGATLLFNLLDRSVPAVGDFCRSLSRATGTTITSDAFVTTQASQGFGRHFDRVSAFVVQVEGEKNWEMYRPSLENPLSDYHAWNDAQLSEDEYSRIFEGAPDLTFTLRPGNVLWVPRGWVHNVFCGDKPSLHMTFGVDALTRHSVARLILDMLAEVPELREDLPLHFWRPENMAAEARSSLDMLLKHAAGLDVDELAAGMRTKVVQQMLPAPVNPVAAAFGLASDVSKAALLVNRIVAIDTTTEYTTLHLGDREITLDGIAKEAVDTALRSENPVIDAASSVDLGGLVSALVQQGVARPVA